MKFTALLSYFVSIHAFDVDIEQFGCFPNAKNTSACTEGFATAFANVSARGGGTVHARGPGEYTVAGIEMRSHGEYIRIFSVNFYIIFATVVYL